MAFFKDAISNLRNLGNREMDPSEKMVGFHLSDDPIADLSDRFLNAHDFSKATLFRNGFPEGLRQTRIAAAPCSVLFPTGENVMSWKVDGKDLVTGFIE